MKFTSALLATAVSAVAAQTYTPAAVPSQTFPNNDAAGSDYFVVDVPASAVTEGIHAAVYTSSGNSAVYMKFAADGAQPASAPASGATNTASSAIPAQTGGTSFVENVVQQTPFELAAASCESGLCKMYIALESIGGETRNRLTVGTGMAETGSDFTMDDDTYSSSRKMYAYANSDGSDVFLQAYMDTDLPFHLEASPSDSSFQTSFYLSTEGSIPSPSSATHSTDFDFDFDDVDACMAAQGRDTCRIYFAVNIQTGTQDTTYDIDLRKLARSRDDDDDDSASTAALSLAAGALGVLALLL